MDFTPAWKEQFWARVDMSRGDDACWIWTGTQGTTGYGQAWSPRPHYKTVQVQRLIRWMQAGEYPKRMLIRFACETKNCCNPRHFSFDAPLTNEQLFWSKVKKTEGCWIWTGCTSSLGYGIHAGRANENGRRGSHWYAIAHRFSFSLIHGSIPKGMEICHKCDNPPCVNPSHLFMGTHTDNMQDMVRKGRSGPRPYNPNQAPRKGYKRLTPIQAEEIRNRLASGISRPNIARELGIGKGSVRSVANGGKYEQQPRDPRTGRYCSP